MGTSRALVAIAAISIEAAPVEVTLAQYRALVVLFTRGPQHMSALGELMKASPSSTTRMAERLERKGLVLRRPDPLSRRSTELVLTEAGTQLVDAVMAVRRREIAAVLAAVPEARRPALRRAFDDFAQAAGEVDPMPTPGGPV